MERWEKTWPRDPHFTGLNKRGRCMERSQPWNSKEYDKNGNILGKYVNGVLQ
jgi:hypothetical protein